MRKYSTLLVALLLWAGCVYVKSGQHEVSEYDVRVCLRVSADAARQYGCMSGQLGEAVAQAVIDRR